MLHTRVDKGVAPIVYLEGEVDLDCTETLRWVVSDAVRGSDQAVLDFAGVRFIDSSGAGIFVRLCKRDGKARYLDLIPRVWALMERDLAHPALVPVAAWFEANIPADLRAAHGGRVPA